MNVCESPNKLDQIYIPWLLPHRMVSLLRTLRSVRRVGLREWWRQMQYIGDAKSGRFVGKDQYVTRSLLAYIEGIQL